MSIFAALPPILVVDDQPIVRRLTYRILNHAGVRVYEAGSAAEALSVLSQVGWKVGLVIIDVVMPDVDGIELAGLILEQRPSQAILFMSAYPAETMVRYGLENPVVHFLAKPFTREQLLRRVQESIDRRLVPRSRGPADRR